MTWFTIARDDAAMAAKSKRFGEILAAELRKYPLFLTQQMNEPRPDEPKLKSIDIKIQAAARRAEQERNAGPKGLDPVWFERDEHMPDGTIKPTSPK
jgi:hypothetical protein